MVQPNRYFDISALATTFSKNWTSSTARREIVNDLQRYCISYRLANLSIVLLVVNAATGAIFLSL